MSELIVANRYAKSLLDLAIEKKVVDEVYKDMADFAASCEKSQELVLAMKSPIIKHSDKLAILTKLFKKSFNPVSFSIFEIITNKNRESVLPAIAKQFVVQYSNYKGIQKAEVIDSLQNELFNAQTINGRYELSLENLKQKHPQAAADFIYFMEHETE